MGCDEVTAITARFRFVAGQDRAPAGRLRAMCGHTKIGRYSPVDLERSVAEVLRLLPGLLPECDPQHHRWAKPGGEGDSGMAGPMNAPMKKTAHRAWPIAAICFQAAGRGPPPIQSAAPAAMPRHCRRGTGSTSERGRAGMLHRWQQSPLPAPACSPCERCR